jgi:hypothetical protein
MAMVSTVPLGNTYLVMVRFDHSCVRVMATARTITLAQHLPVMVRWDHSCVRVTAMVRTITLGNTYLSWLGGTTVVFGLWQRFAP